MPDVITSAKFTWRLWLFGPIGFFIFMLMGMLTPGSEGRVVLILIACGWPALLMWLAAAGFGGSITRFLPPRWRHRLSIKLALGMAAMLWLVWLLGVAGLLNALTAWGILTIGIALMLFQHRLPNQANLSQRITQRHAWLLIAGIPLGLLLSTACFRPGTLWSVEAFGYDAISYHLQLPREWQNRGQLVGLHHSVYSYLPDLVEVGYWQIMQLKPAMPDWAIACQLFHASFVIVIVLSLGGMMKTCVRKPLAMLVATCIIAVPWIVITGSLAYSELAMLAFATAAMGMTLRVKAKQSGVIAAIGFLLGAATLCKLTAGPMFALPTLVWLAIKPGSWTRRLSRTGLCVMVITATLTPWLVRNTMETGNPVFPFAAEVFGAGHWNHAQVTRWHAAHFPDATLTQRFDELAGRWIFNMGFASVIGGKQPHADHDIATFAHRGWVPTLHLLALAGLLIAWRDPRRRRVALVMVMFLAIQLSAWLFCSHLQSRFLIPTLLPMLVLVSLVWSRCRPLRPNRVAWSLWAIPLLMCVLLIPTAILREEQLAPGLTLRQALTAPMDQHPINALPVGSRVYLAGDQMRLIYLKRDVIYHSPFDTSLLGELMRKHPHDPAAITAQLRARGITHVWINLGELKRLHATLGFDEDVTRQRIEQLAADAHWHELPSDLPVATNLYRLYALP